MFGSYPILVESSIAFVVGCIVAIGVVFFGRPAGKRASFIRNKGSLLAIWVFVALLVAAFVATLLSAIVFIAVNNIFTPSQSAPYQSYLLLGIFVLVFGYTVILTTFRLARASD